MKFLTLLLLLGVAHAAPEDVCTYKTYAWHKIKKKAVDHRLVKTTRGELSKAEIDPFDADCTVCREDQQDIAIEGLPKLTVCKKYAPQVEAALRAIQTEGSFKIRTLKGYRVGKTRGAIINDRRSVYSNHSYGTAIDINARENGLHRKCKLDAVPQKAADIARCKVGVGGPWHPKKRPKTTIVEGGVVHTEFTKFWKWGGALPGQIKDFMHFSVTGE